MIRGHRLYIYITVNMLLTYTGVVAAENIFYENNFESGTILTDVPEPRWLIKGAANQFGPGNLFEISTTTSHSGKYSLRFNYEGRNGKCNLCGNKNITQKSGYDESSYVIDDSGQDLTLDPFFAAPDRIVQNNTNGYSLWKIASIDNQDANNDKLSLIKIKDGIGEIAGEFNSGDSISIARQCGVDGFIGRNIDRRSDCNQAISYFDGVSQEYGQSIFRRIYLKAAVTAAPYHQKLLYWTQPQGGPFILYAEYDLNKGENIHLLLESPKAGGGVAVNRPLNADFIPGVWYYVEQEFRTQSAPGKQDGVYRLWFSESGKESNTPLLELNNIELLPVKTTSLWGNHQHSADSIGSWYIDDIKFSDTKIGPTDATGATIAPPNPPEAQ